MQGMASIGSIASQRCEYGPFDPAMITNLGLRIVAARASFMSI
jgi:hypothetical protein